MRKKYMKTMVGAVMMSLFMTSCSDVLEEQPRSIYEPGYFKTKNGILGGVNSLYAHLRYIYGNGYWLNACLTGTDEYTYGHGGDGNFLAMDMSGVASLNASSSRSDVLWGQAFPNVNTANRIIHNASEIGGVSDAIVAEAYFFRGFDYFMLVQTFGGIPLDLGKGELMYNDSPSRTSVRNTVPEVYTRAIFPDLLKAIADLPDHGRVTGGVTKTLARLYLAKAYLTYGWWLENPNNIPTYPECDRVDPDGHNAQWYFQQANDIATKAIDEPGSFGLQDTYYDVNLAQNDRNKEILLYADHIESSEYYDGSSHSYNSGSSPGNFAAWMVTWDYTFLESAKKLDRTDPARSVQREAAQAYGRPWKCMAPPIDVFTKTFADKTNDSRYDGTFVASFRGNWQKGGIKNPVLYNANGLEVKPGDAILTFLDEEPATPIVYPEGVGKSNVGAGELPGRADYVISPRGISRYAWPNLWKIGTYRTDYNKETELGQPNGGITRPFPVAKFSELYLVAAEAAVKGATTKEGKTARELVNELRARAGKWRWSNNGNVAKDEDRSTEMVAATPAVIDVDYILAERSREFFGEGYRWHDLVRTQRWKEMAATYEICGKAVGDHTPVVYKRTIEDFHYLRPIPTGQLDGLEMTDAEKTAYQNPGYRE